jgi:hypothetical protein
MAAGDLPHVGGDDLNADESLALFDLPDSPCSEVESIRWVADNISRVDVSPHECPSAVAWTLLQACRDNVAFRIEFLTKMWPKLLPNRTHMDDPKDKSEVDGRPTLELIDRIQGIRDKAIDDTTTAAVDVDDGFETFEDYKQ